MTRPANRLVEVDRYNYTTVYFESESTRDAYVAITVERHSFDVSDSLDNPTDGYPDVVQITHRSEKPC